MPKLINIIGTEFSDEFCSEISDSFSNASSASYRHRPAKREQSNNNDGVRDSRRVSFFIQQNSTPVSSFQSGIHEHISSGDNSSETLVSRRSGNQLFYEQDASAFFWNKQRKTRKITIYTTQLIWVLQRLNCNYPHKHDIVQIISLFFLLIVSCILHNSNDIIVTAFFPNNHGWVCKREMQIYFYREFQGIENIMPILLCASWNESVHPKTEKVSLPHIIITTYHYDDTHYHYSLPIN